MISDPKRTSFISFLVFHNKIMYPWNPCISGFGVISGISIFNFRGGNPAGRAVVAELRSKGHGSTLAETWRSATLPLRRNGWFVGWLVGWLVGCCFSGSSSDP